MQVLKGRLFLKTISNILAVFLSITVYLSCVSTYASAIAVSTTVAVKPVKQAKSNWCWAACAEMCGKTIYDKSPRDQFDVVQFIKHSQDNVTGTGYDCIAACEYVACNLKTFTRINGTLDLSQLGSHFSKKQGVVATIKNPNVTPNHDVLLNGTQIVDGNGGTRFFIDYIDPIDCWQYHELYDDFCNGNTNSYKGYKAVVMIYAE